MKAEIMLLALGLALVATGCDQPATATPPPAASPVTSAPAATNSDANPAVIVKVTHTDEEWRKILTPEQYHILREAGTDAPFTGPIWDNHKPGTYRCSGCGLELFASATKFESGTGWPSFYQPVAPVRVILKEDDSVGMQRTEVQCARCLGHLGHVFDDGPVPTGKRFCMDTAALVFIPATTNK